MADQDKLSRTDQALGQVTPQARPARWQPPEQVEEYRILEPLGHGAMGQVYVAHDTLLDRRVAIKFLSAVEPRADSRERFFVEARAIARLQHPNVVAIHRVGQLAGHPYLVSELVPGQDLERLPKPLPCQRVRDIALGLARGLSAAHKRGVLHRDIKPANVILSEDGEVKLLDFGLAKLVAALPHAGQGDAPRLPEQLKETLDPGEPGPAGPEDSPPSLTSTGALVGTPLFMAPEIWQGHRATPHSDIYSLGALLFELCSGRPPHHGPSLAALQRSVLDQEAPPLAGLVPGMDPRLAAIIMRCLRRDPAERFASGEELRRALEQLTSRRDLPLRRLALVGLLLLLGLGWAGHRWRRADQQRQAAEQQARLVQQEEGRRAKEAKQEELGKKAAALAAQPGKLLEALTTAIAAVAPSLREHRAPPATAADALVAAITGRQFVPLLRTLPGSWPDLKVAVLAPDGRQVLTAGGKVAELWDAERGRLLLLLEGHDADILAAAIAPDGKRIATAGRDSTARLWDVPAKRELLALRGHAGAVSAVCFSPDGARVLTAAQDGTARLWDGRTGALLATLGGHTGWVHDAAFSPDGGTIVTAGEDGTARLWDGRTGRATSVLLRHGSPVLSAELSRDGQRVLTAGADGAGKLWLARTGRLIATLAGPPGPVADIRSSQARGAAFSPDGARVLTALSGPVAELWDGHTGRRLGSLRGHTRAIASVAFSPDGARLLTASEDGTSMIWDTRTFTALATMLSPDGPLRTAQFAADGHRVLTTSGDSVRLWDERLQKLPMTLRGQAVPSVPPVGAEVHSPDGRRTVRLADTADLLDRATGRPLAVLDRSGLTTTATFSPDSRRLVTADGATAHVWDAETGQDLGALAGHTGRIHSARFSPDGTHIVTASEDRTVRLWDVLAQRRLLLFQGHSAPVLDATFSADGLSILATCADQTARQYPVRVEQFFAGACHLLDYGAGQDDVAQHCAAVLGRPPSSVAQPPVAAAPVNVDFMQGRPGEAPPGWSLWEDVEDDGYRAALLADCPAPGQRCALLQQDGPRSERHSAGLLQTVEAGPYRGKRVRLRAMARDEVSGTASQVYLTMRTEGPNWRGAFQSARQVASGGWHGHEIVGDVPDDADSLSFELLLRGQGRAWISGVQLEVAPDAPPGGPQNLDLEEGDLGQMPAGWSGSSTANARSYRAVLTEENPSSGRRCARVGQEGRPTPGDVGSLGQHFDAGPYRGKRVRLRAAVRMAATAQGDRAQLWLRVDRWHGQRGAFDNMENRPIVSSEWRDYDIVADVADDAVSISIGLFVRGGTAWLDAVRFEIAPDARPTSLSNAFPQDLDMEQGEIGQPPPGWQLDGEPGALAAITQDRPRHGKRCVLLSFQGESSPSYHGLYQTVDAAPYRGKRVRLRVAVRTDFAGLGAGTAPWPRNRAQLVLEVILSDLKTGFSDSMENRPIVSTEWRDYEIVGDVASDASFINIGLFLAGQGRAWFDDVRFDIIGDAQPQHP